MSFTRQFACVAAVAVFSVAHADTIYVEAAPSVDDASRAVAFFVVRHSLPSTRVDWPLRVRRRP